MSDRTRPQILAVDDNDAVLDALALVLGDHYEVLTATSGAQALGLFEAHRVAVILLDLLMARMPGTEVLSAIRATNPRAVVIILTAVAEVSAVVAAMKLGAWDYITKPWNDEALLSTVGLAVHKARSIYGALLISDDPIALAPLEVVLERDIKVEVTARARWLLTDFDVRLVVVDDSDNCYAPSRHVSTNSPSINDLTSKYPNAAIISLMAASRANEDRVSFQGRAITITKPYGLDDLLNTIASLLPKGIAVAPRRRLSRPVLAAFDFMKDKYNAPVTVQDIAYASGVSAGRLAHIFREETGMTVKDYLLRLKIAVARRLLIESHRKLEDIAQQAGFSDTSHFSRVFTNAVGHRPGKYRRQNG